MDTLNLSWLLTTELIQFYCFPYSSPLPLFLLLFFSSRLSTFDWLLFYYWFRLLYDLIPRFLIHFRVRVFLFESLGFGSLVGSLYFLFFFLFRCYMWMLIWSWRVVLTLFWFTFLLLFISSFVRFVNFDLFFSCYSSTTLNNDNGSNERIRYIIPIHYLLNLRIRRITWRIHIRLLQVIPYHIKIVANPHLFLQVRLSDRN